MNKDTSKDGALGHLIKQLAGLPGLGPRSARRAALHLVMRKEDTLRPLAAALNEAADKIQTCPNCGNLDDLSPCRICQDHHRDHGLICVISGVSDLWAIERTGGYRGVYHVLGGILSALDGISIADLSLDLLKSRIEKNSPREIILALPATVDGQATAHVVMDMLSETPVKTSRLAHGMPVGGELDYLDDGTILTAFRARG
ncbi:MAG: recombination protein RecR [Alphaproteobacteria bacterium]|nr:recombination protein RecR [Alphaproteobacteria bacterium]